MRQQEPGITVAVTSAIAPLTMHRLLAIFPAVLLSASSFATHPGAQPSPTLQEQRAVFREAYAAAELGNWQPAQENAALLRDYVLWPDLRAAWLGASIASADDADIRAFLDRYASLKPARELRYRYTLYLAKSGRTAEFLDLYRAFYQGLHIARLDCLALHAEILSGKAPKAAGRAMALWLVDHSQADECDPVFEYMRGAGLLTDALYGDRYQLALSARNYSLARYLARSLDDARLAEAEAWLSAQSDPAGFLESAAEGPDGENQRERIQWAIERIAFSDAPLAERYWQQIGERLRFPDTQAAALDRHIALWHARQHDPDALRRLNALPRDVTDDEVRRWQARVALAQHEWVDVLAIIDTMPEAQRSEEEWRYWHAVALRQTGSAAEARDALLDLSRQRSYYGFLAADELGLDYAYDHVTVTPDHGTLQKLSESAAFIRARELFYGGLESRGRSEWDEAVATLSKDEKVQAGLLAHRWGWHSRAIATLAAAGQFDDLELRYPLPWPEEFAEAAATARIPSSWAYGVARSESLFIPDIRSQAGAIGIMQLMPATGRRTAGELNLPYRGLATLTDPASNIRLGATYLGKMLERFEENRVVATAAYNAGPTRVEKWLPASRSLDARIWIENIPYNETRDYVRRVLVSEAIFNWRLTGRTWRVSEGLGTIGPAPSRVAATSP